MTDRHVRGRPRHAAGVAAISAAVALAGCGGSGSGTSASGAAVTEAPSAAAASSTPAVRPHGSTAGPRPVGSSGAGPSTPAAAASPSSPAAAAPSRRPAASGVPLPPTGTFTYAVNGSSTSAFGTQKVDGNSTLTVSRIGTGEERTKQQDQGGTTEQTLLARAGGLYLTDVHISQQGFDEDFRPNGSALLFPAHPTQGRQWSWSMTSTDGSYTLRGALTIADLHSSATTGDGSRVKTVSIASVLHIDGSSLHLVTHQRDEAAYDAMIVRERSVTDGTAYGTTIHSDATRVLSHRAS